MASVEQRVSLVTLGVANLARSSAFYERLGWKPSPRSQDDIVFFQAAGMVVGLWDRAALAEDSVVDDGGGWGGITFAHNVRSPEEVDSVLARAEEAGATIGRRGAPTEWEGYSGVFHDPDGHPWEVAYNPFWPLDSQGAVYLPDPDA